MKQQISFQDLINKYKIHDENNIKGFFGDYRFLSNFHLCDVWFEGILYPSSENAYMASKTLDPNIRILFSKNPPAQMLRFKDKKDRDNEIEINPNKHLSPAGARKFGQTIELRPDWENIKYDMMLSIVFDKFWRNKDIQILLLDTGDKYLEELNHWGDKFWGVYTWDSKAGRVYLGENNLGKILMKVRNCLKK